MASGIDIPEIVEIEDQMAFNLAAWEELLGDSRLNGLPFRIETDRFGHIIMSPPPAPEHGEYQAGITCRLKQLLPHGRVITECPVSTTEGVKLVDVAWISKDRRDHQGRRTCFTRAPEICVEVISPGNTRQELAVKRSLYFETGAEEVWFCHGNGRVEFFWKDAPMHAAAASKLCPEFPQKLDL